MAGYRKNMIADNEAGAGGWELKPAGDWAKALASKYPKGFKGLLAKDFAAAGVRARAWMQGKCKYKSADFYRLDDIFEARRSLRRVVRERLAASLKPVRLVQVMDPDYGTVRIPKRGLPHGLIHLTGPAAERRKLAGERGVDWAAAIIGWGGRGASLHPVSDGIVIEDKAAYEPR
ncbi:MAG: hypothetical protein A2X49_12725 [Lentisphaerae bacterium GWF2_52_8]|nr:MAG: hypothetical protein A2X49_12725 [Lentisphaerae bacterium GWF2_52_8]